MKFLVLIALSLGFLTACGGGGGSSPTVLKYNIPGENCTTEEHAFNSLDKYCAALQDEDLNKGCAIGAREDKFKQDCPGQAWKGFTFINN